MSDEPNPPPALQAMEAARAVDPRTVRVDPQMPRFKPRYAGQYVLSQDPSPDIPTLELRIPKDSPLLDPSNGTLMQLFDLLCGILEQYRDAVDPNAA